MGTFIHYCRDVFACDGYVFVNIGDIVVDVFVWDGDTAVYWTPPYPHLCLQASLSVPSVSVVFVFLPAPVLSCLIDTHRSSSPLFHTGCGAGDWQWLSQPFQLLCNFLTRGGGGGGGANSSGDAGERAYLLFLSSWVDKKNNRWIIAFNAHSTMMVIILNMSWQLSLKCLSWMLMLSAYIV